VQPRSLRAKGAHGLALHLLEWSREGVPLLLLHGFGNEAHLWDDYAPSVAPYYRVLALDLRGHGDSGWDPGGRYGTGAMVSDLEALTAELGIGRLVLVGFSMGGRVATAFAGRHPERLAGLVLVDVGPEVDLRGALRIRQEVAEQRAPSFASAEEYAELLSLSYPAGRRAALLRMARFGLRERPDGRHELKMDPRLRGATAAVQAALPDAAAEEPGGDAAEAQWDALARVTCPTLVVRGAASDVLSPETADRMVEQVLRDGRLAVVPQAAHSVMTDNPEGFEAALNAFLLA
jgi:pimeloyl-ACP methyl ester carboxylesterase